MEQTSLRKLTTGSFYLVIDYVVTAFLGMVFWVIVAKMVPAEEVGQASTVVALSSMLLVFVSLGMQVTASKFISEYNAKGEFGISRAVYHLCIKLTTVTSLIVAALLAVFSNIIAVNVYNSSSLTLLIVLAAFMLPLQAVITALNGSFQGCQRMEFCAISDFAHSVARLIVATILIMLGFRALGVVLGFLLGSIASTLLGFLILIPRALPKSRQTLDLDSPQNLLGNILKFSMPNYVVSIAGTIRVQIAFVLLGIYSMATVAYYNIAFLIMGVFYGVSGSIGTALLPTVSEEWVKGQRRSVTELLNFVIRVSLVFGGPLFLTGILFPEYILSLISPDYSAASLALKILMVAVVLMVIGGCTLATLNGVGRPRIVMLISLISAVTCMGLNILLIPVWAMTGVAIAYMISTFVGSCLGVLILKVREGINLDLIGFFKPLLCILLSVMTSYLVFSSFQNIYLVGFTTGITYLITIRMFNAITKDEIRTLVNLAHSLIQMS